MVVEVSCTYLFEVMSRLAPPRSKFRTLSHCVIPCCHVAANNKATVRERWTVLAACDTAAMKSIDSIRELPAVPGED